METKPGVRTTEFWLHNLVTLANLLNVLGAWNFAPNKYSVYAQAIITGLYALARGLAKAGVPASVPTDMLGAAIASRLASQTTPPAAQGVTPPSPQT